MAVLPWETKEMLYSRFILQSQRLNTWANLVCIASQNPSHYLCAGGMPVETRASCQGVFWAVFRHVPLYQSWVLSKLGHCLKI